LAADSDRLELDPPLPLEVVPWADDLQLGVTLEVTDELSAGSASLLGVDGPLDVDLGGRVRFGEAAALTAGDRAGLAAALGWELEIDVISDGEWVWGLDAQGRALARLPVSPDGAAVGLMPARVRTLIATRSGHANSPALQVERGLSLRVGDRGVLTLEARERVREHRHPQQDLHQPVVELRDEELPERLAQVDLELGRPMDCKELFGARLAQANVGRDAHTQKVCLHLARVRGERRGRQLARRRTRRRVRHSGRAATQLVQRRKRPKASLARRRVHVRGWRRRRRQLRRYRRAAKEQQDTRAEHDRSVVAQLG
jgi:hypothetical protein